MSNFSIPLLALGLWAWVAATSVARKPRRGQGRCLDAPPARASPPLQPSPHPTDPDYTFILPIYTFAPEFAWAQPPSSLGPDLHKHRVPTICYNGYTSPLEIG